MTKMLKRDYFLMAMQAGAYKYKDWVLSVFTVTEPNATDFRPNRADYEPGAPEPHPYYLYREPNGKMWFFDSGEAEVEVVGGHKDGPLCSPYDELVLEAGDLVNLSETVVSTYGQAFLNQLCLCHALGNKIPYINGEMKVGVIEGMIEKRLVDTDEPNKPDDAITVDELLAFQEACIMSAEYAMVVVPAASVKTMTVNPEIHKRRKELMEKYKDRLHDPVVQTQIAQELIQMDRDWMKGDVGEGFYFKDKSYDVVRKKVFLMIGSESGFGVSGRVVDKSLDEGWDPADMPSMVNGLRDGSYNRGAMTALGGEATKFNYRIFQNTRVVGEDCKSPYGITVKLTKAKLKHYVGNSVVQDGKTIELTPENIDKYLDKTVRVRSPLYCLAPGANFCACCIGKRIASTPEALSTYAADIGSTFMYIAMQAMHGKSMKVARLDWREQFR